MGSRSQSNVFNNLRAERVTCDYLHLNNTPIRVNGYPFGTADLPNTANFITRGSLQQADWLTVNPNSVSFIRNRPQLSRVALTGDFADLANAPDAVPVNADWTEQDATRLAFIENKPSLSVVGTSGRYSDLVPESGQPTVPTTVDYDATSSSGTTLAIVNKPVVPPPQVNADWGVTTAANLAFIRNKPSLSAVALSGSFGDLLGKPTVYQTVDWNATENAGTTLAIVNRPTIPDPHVNADWTANTGPAAILNRPSIPAPQVNSDWNVATGAAAILNKPRIPADQINSDWLATQGSVAYIANRPSLGKVATSNNYGDLDNLPTITPQQPSDWTATSGVAFIQNKPNLQPVAFTAKYSDLLASSGQPTLPTSADWALTSSTSSTLAIRNKPSIPAAQVQSDWSQRDSAQISYIINRPNLATVATSGSYNDLINKPTTSAGVAQADYTQTDSTQPSFIQNKPVLKTVATTGKYSDLVANSGQPAGVTAADWNATSATGTIIPVVNKPILPAAQVNADWNSTSGLSQILNLPTFGAVAFSNAYADLSGRPPVPVNADWNSTSGLSQILNRPALGLVATTNSYYDLSNLPTGLSAFTNDSGFYKSGDDPTFGSTTTSRLDAAFVNLTSANPLYLASDLASSIDALAGTLTYNPPGGACTPADAVSGSVDLIGAGATAGSRLLNLWDSVMVQGTLGVTGVSTLKGVTATTVAASGGLTAASLATRGNLTVTGTMAIAGAASTGALTANSVSTTGTLTVTGASSVGALTATGACSTGALTAASINTAGAASTGALTATSVSTGGNLSVTGTASTGALTSSSISTTGTASTGALMASGVVTANTGINLPGTKALNFGSDVTKETNAGRIGYGSLTPGVLDVIGGGTATGSRAVKVWDNLTVPGTCSVGGTFTVTGTASTGALVSSSISTPALTVAGSPVFAQVNADWNANSGSAQILNKPTKLTQFTNDLTGASGGWNLTGSNVLNFGSDVAKGSNAGTLGYQTTTVGALDIYGAGTTVGTRGVKLWDNVTIPGTLTVAGSPVFAQVNADWNATSGVAQILNKPSSVGGDGAGVSAVMPAFTSASPTGGFTVSASSIYSTGFPAWQAFDVKTSTSWLSGAYTYATGVSAGEYGGSVNTGGVQGEYLQVQTPSAYQLQSYRLFGSTNHYLSDFTIMGSSDLSTWTTIDTRTSQDCRTQKNFTAPAQTTTFTYFRLIIRRDKTEEGSFYAVVSEFAPVFSGSGGSAVNADWNATSGSAQILNKPTKLTQFTNDLAGSSGGWNLTGSNVLNFGSDLTKDLNAGTLGYQTTTVGALDIYGAGTTVGSRGVKLWDNVTIPGTLTVAGSPVSAQVNADWNATSGAAQILNKPSTVGGGGGGGVTIPYLTSSMGGGYTVSASTISSGRPAWQAFDADYGTFWGSGAFYSGTTSGTYTGSVTSGGVLGEYLQVQTPSAYQLQSYRLFGSSTHYLSDFTIMGSSDLSTWTTIDTRSSQDCRTEQAYTAPGQSTSFTSFRLIIRRDQTTDATKYTAVANFVPVFVIVATIPALTSSTGGGYSISASSAATNYPAWQAFDADTSSSWISAPGTYAQNSGNGVGFGQYTGNVTTVGISGEYLQVQTPSACQLQSYRLFGSTTHYLNNFQIMGSIDSTTWTIIDTRSSQDCRTEKSYTAPAQTAYFGYFRLIITQDQNTQNGSTFTVVTNFAPVFTSGGTGNADWNATSGSAQILNKPTNLTQFTNDLTGASGVWNLTGSNVLNFGSDVTKETNAGKIGYQLSTPGFLDVYGSGTAVGSRNVQLWDNVTVPGVSTFTGRVNANGGAVVTGGLTVDGQTVTGGTGSTAKKVPWTTVPLASGTNGGNLQVSVDALGIGRLRGGYGSGTLGYTIHATIPAGARPISDSYYPVATNAGTVAVFIISSSGPISQISGPTNGYTFYWSGITYDTSY